MQEVAKLPMMELDCNISFTITTTQTNKDKKNGYIHLQVPKQGLRHGGAAGTFQRHTKCVSAFGMALDNGEFQTVATSLLPSFALADIRELYHLRWGLETAFRGLKYMLGWSISTGSLMLQELYADLTAFNFASRVCC